MDSRKIQSQTVQDGDMIASENACQKLAGNSNKERIINPRQYNNRTAPLLAAVLHV